MPEITITLTDQELEQLTETARSQAMTPSRLAWQIVKRQLSKGHQAPRSSSATRNERMGRQLALVRHLEDLPTGTTLDREQKRELARKFNVTERTIYRDVELAAQVVAERRAGTGGVLTR